MREDIAIKTINDCFSNIRNGANIRQFAPADGIPITRIETLSNNIFNRDRLGYANVHDYSKYSDYILKDGDILMSHINSEKYLGRAVKYKKQGNEIIIHGMNLLRLIPIREFIIPSFAEYIFKSFYFKAQIAKITKKAVNQASFTINDLKRITIPVPPIAEQERIVRELDLLSGIIDKQRAQLKELDTLAQSIFYSTFGDPITNEKGWEVIEMDKLYDIGSSKRVFEAQWTDSGVPFYRAREIVKLSKNEPIESPIFIPESLYREYSEKYGVPSEGDMMVTAVGTLGVCYIVKSSDRFYFKDGNTLWFKSKGLCETRFIKDQYSTSFVKNQIQGNANAAVVGTYTIINAKKTKVIVPPIALQKEYVEKIETIEKQKELIKQSISETEALFNSRMDYYFD